MHAIRTLIHKDGNLNSHEPTMIVNNVIGLAKTAKAFGVPVILTTVVAARGGKIIKGIQDVFPNNEVIDRSFINRWQDERVVTAVKATKRKKLVLASSASNRSTISLLEERTR
jgi:nicotinamidase-related amidase